jgi:hypothetical protein
MLLSYFEWLYNTGPATYIRESTWAHPVIQTFHLFGLVLIFGGTIVLSLRLFGLMMKDRPISEVAAQVSRWTVIGICMNLITGFALFSAEAIKYYDSGPFWLKMSALLAAILFHFAVYRRVTRRDDAGPLLRGVTGALGITLWFSVGMFGRAIGFF